MAIGTLAAVGLAAAGVGAAVSAGSQKSAANKAAQASTYAADQSAAVQREQLYAAQSALSPYQARGNAAGNQISALLGLGGGVSAGQPALASYGYAIDDARDYGNDYAYSPRQSGVFGNGWQTPPFNPKTSQPQSATDMARGAFDIFRNSTGYKFRLDEGYKGLNSGYAGSGILQSGAALNAAQEYGQNFASNEFGNYMAYLGNQQGVGLSASSALAGVGQNFANSISNINDARASGIGNAALISGNNNPFANALGTVGGFALSYGRGK